MNDLDRSALRTFEKLRRGRGLQVEDHHQNGVQFLGTSSSKINRCRSSRAG